MTSVRIAFLLMLTFVACTSVRAHGYVVRAIPADRSTLERPPTRLQYWFSEDLERRFSEIKLRDQSGAIIASGGVDEENGALLSLRLPPGLPDGAYIVELRPAFVSDGHVIAESRVFFVGEEVGGVSGQVADDRAIPLEVLWRYLLGIGNMLFFGTTALYGMVLLPAWGSAARHGGRLPVRVMQRLRFCLIAGIALAFIGNLIALLQQSMVFFNAQVAQVIEQNLWQVVQIGSRFGDVWTFRMVLLLFTAILIAVAEYYRELMPKIFSGIWRGMIWLAALFIGLTMITSHAAGSLVMPWIAILVNWIHALAVAFWVGGIAALMLVLPGALEPYEGEERRRVLRTLMLRFSRIVTLMVGIVIATGIYNALNFFVSPKDLASSYGGSLGIKLIMVAMLIAVGGWQHIALRPQLADRISQRMPRLGAAVRAISLITWLRLEAILAVLALLAVAWLSATPIPEPQNLQIYSDTPQTTQTIADLSITVAVLPGGPGVNSYDVSISRADAPLADVNVFIQQVNPERGRRSHWYLAEAVETGLYTAAGDDIDAEGKWWTLVDIIDQNGDMLRAAYEWQISELASVQQTRDPNVLHVFALLVVAVVLAAAAYPLSKRLLLRLNIGWISAVVAAGAVLVAAAVMGMGSALIGEQQRNYELTLNPPPTIINSVLPDADSLRRGEALYREFCLLWQGQSASFRNLRNQLATVRDDSLHAVVTDGWRDLPACEGELSEKQRWDIVNYFRIFEEREY